MCLKPRLQFPTKPLQVNQIDAAIHVAEAVCRADYGISLTVEYVAVRYPNIGHAHEALLPSLNHFAADVTQLEQDLAHGSSGFAVS
jgi:hypothetical protein